MMLLFKLSQIMAFLIACGCIANLPPETAEDSSKCNFNIILCIDSSSSVSQAKFEEEVSFTQKYYNKANEYSKTQVELAIILYATNTRVTLDFTNDIEEINKAFIRTKSNRLEGGTFTSRCLIKAKEMSKPNNYPNLVLVVTDGDDTSSRLKKAISDVVHNHTFLVHAAQFGKNLETRGLMELVYKRKNFLTDNTLAEIENKLNAFIDSADICKEIITCETLPYMPGVVNLNCQNKKQNESCSIECGENYDKTSDTITCLGRDAWTPHDACKKVACDRNLNILHSENSECVNHQNGDFCQITCQDNYVINTEIKMLCKNNEWMNVPTCTLIRCPENVYLPHVDNAKSIEYNFGETDERYYVYCKEGYINSGTFFECIDGEYWEGNVECIDERCSDLSTNTALDLTDCLNLKVGQECDMKCNEDYKTIYSSENNAQCTFKTYCLDQECIFAKNTTKWVNIPDCILKKRCLDPDHDPSRNLLHNGSCLDKLEGQTCEVECRNDYYEHIERATKEATCALNETCLAIDGVDIDDCTFWKNMPVCRPKCLVKEGIEQHKQVDWEGCYDSTNGQNCTLSCKGDFLSLETINATLCVLEYCEHGEESCTISAKWENVPECVAPLKSEKQEKIVPLVLVGGSALVAAASAVALFFAPYSAANTITDFPLSMLQQPEFHNDAAIQDAEILIH